MEEIKNGKNSSGKTYSRLKSYTKLQTINEKVTAAGTAPLNKCWAKLGFYVQVTFY